MTPPLLQVENLQVAFSTRHGVVAALHGIDIALEGGETLGIVGESGSGKSVTSLAVMRLPIQPVNWTTSGSWADCASGTAGVTLSGSGVIVAKALVATQPSSRKVRRGFMGVGN